MLQRQSHLVSPLRKGRRAISIAALTLLALPAVLPNAAAQATQATYIPPQKQKSFATPQEAVKALVSAVKAKNRAGIYAVVGDEMRGTMTTGNKLLDMVNRDKFLHAVNVSALATDKEDPKRKIVYFGSQKWPFPAPLVKEGSKWRFDGAAGKEEVEDRRVGFNEMHAIGYCRGYVEAQREYFSKDRDGDGIKEYAQRIISSPDKKDGLYWSSDNDADRSPLGPLFGNITIPPGFNRDPDSGYFFRRRCGLEKSFLNPIQSTLMLCSHFTTSPGHSVVMGSDVGRMPNA